jgi:dephospho-CoA kinase
MVKIGMIPNKETAEMKKIIGLTGGIASGKSTVSNILKELGAVIIDADQIARKIVEKGKPALFQIEQHFGKEVLLPNGELDRKKLGKKVFNNPDLLKKLNEITHPKIMEEIHNTINWYKKDSFDHVIIIDGALLIEMNLSSLADEVWLVILPEELQIMRLMERDGITREEANQRIAAQMPVEEKKKYSNKIIDNSGSRDNLKDQVVKMWLGI